MKSARSEKAKDLGSVAVVLSVIVLIVLICGVPIVGALIEGAVKWEQSFPH